MHTVKGAAGFLGFQQIVDVAHNAETVMKKLRDRELTLSRRLTDAVLRAVDMLRLLLRNIKSNGGAAEDIAPVIRDLVAALEGGRPRDSDARSQMPDARLEPSHVQASTSLSSDRLASDGQPLDSELSPPKSELRTPHSELASPAPIASPERAVQQASDAVAAMKKDALQTLRVDVGKIDKVMDLTGEVVLVRNRLLNIVNRLEHAYAEDRDVQSLLEAVSFLDLITSDMQLGVMKMRMQPLDKVFGKFPRLVRDTAGPLGKIVDLKITGEDTEVDKTVIELIGDPLVHIIRNSIDHGIEPPQERLAAGKPERGTISIAAAQQGNKIVIDISDDGRGINIDNVKRKAVERALIAADEAGRMSEEAAINLIFLPGFSTKDNASELSGRGVGMDVVKTNMAKLNGSVHVATRTGQGAVFTLHIPLTLAIIQTLMVEAAGSRYAVPLAPVEETLMIDEGSLSDAGGMKALLIRGKIYPLFELAGLLGGRPRKPGDHGYAVVISIGDKRFCVAVDNLLGQEEVVIKTVPGVNTHSSHILGATITGDGRVVFILDLASISGSGSARAMVST